jgi:hypothetical protein
MGAPRTTTRPRARLRTRLAVIALGLVAVAGALVGPGAAPAQAWSWSSHVTVAGTSPTCDVNSLPTQVVVRAQTGEVRWGTPNWIGNWGARFTGIPSNGTWAQAWIDCREMVTGRMWGYWSRWFHIGRPSVGDQVNVGRL